MSKTKHRRPKSPNYLSFTMPASIGQRLIRYMNHKGLRTKSGTAVSLLKERLDQIFDKSPPVVKRNR